jgi:hypothetical protein
MYPNGIYPSEWNAGNAGDEGRVGYISIEKMENFAEITGKVVDLAGLGAVVKVRPRVTVKHVQTDGLLTWVSLVLGYRLYKEARRP